MLNHFFGDSGPNVQLCTIIALAVTSQSRLQTSHPLVVGPHPNSSQGRKIVSIEETGDSGAHLSIVNPGAFYLEIFVQHSGGGR